MWDPHYELRAVVLSNLMLLAQPPCHYSPLCTFLN